MSKRLFDIIFSILGLLILSLLLLVISISIILEFKGPVLYRQIRVGRNGIDFHLYKFRTMIKDSDKGRLLTVGYKDSRITRVGYYLRKFKLDELPQLFNVLNGDMSFVGPRPEVRKYVDLYTPSQRQVLKIKPGITDYASIKYRNENEILAASSDPESLYINEIMPSKLKINMDYLHHSNFMLDIKIIFKTLFSVFT